MAGLWGHENGLAETVVERFPCWMKCIFLRLRETFSPKICYYVAAVSPANPQKGAGFEPGHNDSTHKEPPRLMYTGIVKVWLSTKI